MANDSTIKRQHSNSSYGRSTYTSQPASTSTRTTSTTGGTSVRNSTTTRNITKAPQTTVRSGTSTRTTNRGPQVSTKTGGNTRTTTKAPDNTSREGISHRVAVKAPVAKTVVTDSSGSVSTKDGVTYTDSGEDTARTVTDEGADTRVRTVNRVGAENKSSIDFTFKIQIQNRNAIDPAMLAQA